MKALDPIVATLVAERKRQALSLSGLARKAQISKGCLHALEHGERLPTLYTLRRWSEALGRGVALTEPANPAAMRPTTEEQK